MNHPILFIFVSLTLWSTGKAPAQDTPTAVLPVSSTAFFFSPGNWSGDTSRGGSKYRQTWNSGAYMRIAWTTANTNPTAELLLDTSVFGDQIKNPPELTYNIDGRWIAGVKCAETIPIQNLAGAGSHTLTIYISSSEQADRWGTAQENGHNVVRVTGLRLNRDCTSVPAVPAKRWALIVGDSITEGIGAGVGTNDNLASWSYFVGSGLQSIGYEYGVSACGWSGWLRPGDGSGDVPPYYQVSTSPGSYDDARSRWNKIDARNSLLDEAKRLSGYGATGQEPDAILINFGTNDSLTKMPAADLQASITGSLQALQKAAPKATIFIIIPFGQYAAAELAASVAACKSAKKIFIIDLGASVAKGIAADNYWGNLHPNMRGHATFAAKILAQVVAKLPAASAGN